MAVSGDDRLLVADSFNHTIRCISASGEVSTLAGSAKKSGSSDGQGAAARFSCPGGLALSPDGSLFVTDFFNHIMRRVSPEGHVSTVAGAAGQQGSADGPAALARFSGPRGLAFGPDGTLFIAGSGNSAIRCLSSGGIVSTLAGAAGQVGSADGLGAAARFHFPSGLALAPDGCLFVSDSGNCTIRCISPGGLVSTVAGAAGQCESCDGQGAAARFRCPSGIAVHPDGCLYVVDIEDHTLRRISASGEVSTVAGLAGQSGSSSGRGSAARFTSPRGIAAGPDGSLYVTDSHRVLKVR
jgi:DNA-binding beta-propeller fold protein YncE